MSERAGEMTVGIVGAGITGLALGHYLAERDVEVTVFEALDRCGGVIRSVEHDGTVLECGPQRLRLTEPVDELVRSLGIRDELVVADDLPIFVFADGRLREVPTSVRSFVRTDALSVRGKLRLVAEPLTGAGRTDESAADYFARKFGREAYRNVIGPLFGGIYGSDPKRMPVEHALSGVLDLEERHGNLLVPALSRLLVGDRPPAITFDGGVGRLPDALHDRLGDRVALDTPVESIRPRGDGVDVRTVDGASRVDHVVLTPPAGVTATILSEGAPDAATRLRSLTYNPLVLVHVRAPDQPGGFGFQIRRGEPLFLLGASWNGRAFGRDDVATCFLGGMDRPDLVDASDEELASIVREEYASVTGTTPEVLNVERLIPGFPAYDGSWDALSGLSLPDRVHLATNYTARMGIPSRIREAKTLAEGLAG